MSEGDTSTHTGTDTGSKYFEELYSEFVSIDAKITELKQEVVRLRERKTVINRMLAYVGELEGNNKAPSKSNAPSRSRMTKSQKCNAILDYLTSVGGEGAKISDINENIGVPHLRHYLVSLIEEKLVRRTGSTSTTRYFITNKGKEARYL